MAPPSENGDDEDFAALLAEYEQKTAGRRRDPRVGERVQARVISIGADAVFLDLGAKSEGMIDLAELRDAEGRLRVAVGDTVEATVVETDGKAGCIVLRHLLGRGADARGELRQAFEHGIAVEGVISGVNKGGVEVQIAGVRAFCPISQLDLRHVEDAAAFVGQRLSFRISRYEQSGRNLNLVVSRRALLEEEAAARASELRRHLAPGAVLEGTVSSLKDYGAFIDLGGLEGLLHVSEIGFARVQHPKDVLSVGQRVTVQVLKIERADDPKRPEKISLSLKSLERDPWLDVQERFSEGTRASGTVARVEPFGVFLELLPGLEGLLPASELGDRPPSARGRDAWKVGQKIEVTILSLDLARRRIALSLAPAEAATADEGGPSSAGRPGFGTLGDLLRGAGPAEHDRKKRK
jgi:small subunit ribosomal protein S1